MDIAILMLVIVALGVMVIFMAIRINAMGQTIYIKEKEIQELEDENQNLLVRIENYKDYIDALEDQNDYMRPRIQELEDEVYKTRKSVRCGRKLKKITMKVGE